MPQPPLGLHESLRLHEFLLEEFLVPTEAEKEDKSLVVSSEPHDGHSTASLVLDELTNVSNFLSHFLH